MLIYCTREWVLSKMKKMKTERESASYFFNLYSLSQVFKGATKLSFFLCIIHVWSLFCSVWNNMSVPFLSILLVKLGFHLSVFWFLVFLYLWLLGFSFSVLCFEFKFISKDLITVVLSGSEINNVLYKTVFTLFKWSVKIKELCYKKNASR